MKTSSDSNASAWEKQLGDTLRQEASQTTQPLDKVVREARRKQGVKDILGLAFGSLWLALAALVGPLVTRLHRFSTNASKN
ncbi:MAG: hypothetical protein OHK005_01310 [Candidatus Methylacidiphilales bacterium]